MWLQYFERFQGLVNQSHGMTFLSQTEILWDHGLSSNSKRNVRNQTELRLGGIHIVLLLMENVVLVVCLHDSSWSTETCKQVLKFLKTKTLQLLCNCWKHTEHVYVKCSIWEQVSMSLKLVEHSAVVVFMQIHVNSHTTNVSSGASFVTYHIQYLKRLGIWSLALE